MTRQGRDDMMAPRSMTWGPGAVAAHGTNPSTPGRTTPSRPTVSVGGAAVEEAAHGNRNLLDHLGRSDVVVEWDDAEAPSRPSCSDTRSRGQPTRIQHAGIRPGRGQGRRAGKVTAGPPPDDAT